VTKEELRARVKALEAAAEKQREELAALSREVDEPAVEASSVTQVKKLMVEVCAHIGWSDGRVHIAMGEWNALWYAIRDLPDEDPTLDMLIEAAENWTRCSLIERHLSCHECEGKLRDAAAVYRKAHK